MQVRSLSMQCHERERGLQHCRKAIAEVRCGGDLRRRTGGFLGGGDFLGLAFFVTALTFDEATALAIFDAVPAVIPAAFKPFNPALITSDLEFIPAAAGNHI